MVQQAARPISEPFTLNQIDTTLIPSGSRADGTANTWITIWSFQIPAGIGMTLTPESMLAVYLEDDSPAEVSNNTCLVQIAIGDTSKADSRVIYGPIAYVQVKEFQDRRKMARLQLPAPVHVLEEQFINIQVKDDGTIDESDSRFQLSMFRTR